MLVMLGHTAFSAETVVLCITPQHSGDSRGEISKIVPGLIVTYYDAFGNLEKLTVPFPGESSEGIKKILKKFISQYNKNRRKVLEINDGSSLMQILPPQDD